MTAHDAEIPEMHFGRHVALSMLLVVASFSATLVVSQWRLQPIEALALDIARDAAPSIEHLSAVRTELIRLGMYVNEYVTHTDNGGMISRDDIQTVRRRLDAEINAYRALPSSPEETKQLKTIEDDLTVLDRATENALDEADATSFESARLTSYAPFHDRLERVDESVARLKGLNTNHAQARSEDILRARRVAMTLTTVLGMVSLVVAIIASILVLRVLRGRNRLMTKHGRLLAERATELEAFAGRVAHDLKNPLGTMALLVLLAARRRGDDPKLREDLDRLTSQVKGMDQIIDGLLAFARSGANPPSGARADLRTTLDEVVADVRASAEAVSAELQVASFSATQLACSPAALTSVLSNLLCNAVKYIGDGKRSPRRISIHVKDHHDELTRIEVEDTGPGLPPGSEHIIFEPFRRLTNSNQPGIGLGLATVKKIVEAYKGRVGVVSTWGSGSTFWFEMPKAPRDVAPARSAPNLPRGRESPAATAQ
jgi:signal transduction histidine kinase